MIKILSNISFKFILGILAFHTFISHPHSDELSIEEHKELHNNAKSLIGIIRLAFHESDDESLDHLLYIHDGFCKKIDSKVKNIFVSLKDNFQYSANSIITEGVVNCDVNNCIKLFFVKLNGLRGPPLLYYIR